MICFEHPDAPAVAVCRTCGRGVCPKCAKVSDHGIACSEKCQELGDKLHKMNLRALNLYGLGQQKPSRLTNWLLIYCLPGFVFFLFGAGSSVNARSVDAGDAFAMVLGAVLLGTGIWGHIRQRRIGL